MASHHSYRLTHCRPPPASPWFIARLLSLGVDEQITNDWLAVRKRKRAETTLTAIAGVQREAEKANLPLNDALRICSERGWQGFSAEWVQHEPNGGGSIAAGSSKRFDDWHRSEAGIKRKARELGFGDGRTNETWDSLKTRCWDEIKRRERERASPKPSYHDDRADTIAQLTGRKPAHQPATAEAIDVDATEHTRKLG